MQNSIRNKSRKMWISIYVLNINTKLLLFRIEERNYRSASQSPSYLTYHCKASGARSQCYLMLVNLKTKCHKLKSKTKRSSAAAANARLAIENGEAKSGLRTDSPQQGASNPDQVDATLVIAQPAPNSTLATADYCSCDTDAPQLPTASTVPADWSSTSAAALLATDYRPNDPLGAQAEVTPLTPRSPQLVGKAKPPTGVS